MAQDNVSDGVALFDAMNSDVSDTMMFEFSMKRRAVRRIMARKFIGRRGSGAERRQDRMTVLEKVLHHLDIKRKKRWALQDALQALED